MYSEIFWDDSNSASAVRQRGFSLYELLVALAIAGGITALATGLFALVNNANQTTEVNAFIGYLNLARSEAIKRRHQTVLCPSSNGRSCDSSSDYTWWHRGMLLFVDTDGDHQPGPSDTVIQVHSVSSSTLNIKSSRGRRYVAYHPTGFASGTNITFTFCDPRGMRSVRYVIVSNTGRPRVSSTPPDGRADEGLERCT